MIQDDLLSDLGKVPVQAADNSGMTIIEDLKRLAPGDLVRNSTEHQFRVQKHLLDGLRLRDNDGARDFSYGQLVTMNLRKVEHDETGPAARRLGELRAECERQGIDCSHLHSSKDFEIALGDHFAKISGADSLPQIGPMLASDAKDLQDYDLDQPWLGRQMSQFWDNELWYADEKVDGVRLKLHLTSKGGRLDSRRRDTKTRRFSEKTANFPHVQALTVPGLEGTVLDCEGMLDVKFGVSPVSGKPFYGSLPITTACANAGPASARLIQNEFGPMKLYVFDIIRLNGTDVSQQPAVIRRAAVQKIVAKLHETHPETREWLVLTRISENTRESKLALFRELIQAGGEGIIFKKATAPYQVDKRSKDWMKLKKFQEVDAFVTGYIPGEHGYTGLVGAMELSVMIDDQIVGIAAVSQFELEERKAMTAPDGSLRPEYYDRVVTFRGQELTKRGRFRHAIFVTWREDKTSDDCTGYEIKDELKALKVI